MTRSVEIPDEAVEKVGEVIGAASPDLAAYPDRLAYTSRAALVAARPYLMPPLDRAAVCEKIADWYSAHYNPDHDIFYETDDRGVSGDEDENAMHAYRGFKLALALLNGES